MLFFSVFEKVIEVEEKIYGDFLRLVNILFFCDDCCFFLLFFVLKVLDIKYRNIERDIWCYL